MKFNWKNAIITLLISEIICVGLGLLGLDWWEYTLIDLCILILVVSPMLPTLEDKPKE